MWLAVILCKTLVKMVLEVVYYQNAGFTVSSTIQMVCSEELIASNVEVALICGMFFCQKHNFDVILLEEFQFFP